MNSRSLANKLSNFQSYVYSTSHNIYCITETWLSNSVFDCEILPCEYTVYRKDRGSQGGGVLIAVHESVPSVLISSPEELEIITVNLNCLNGPITLCTVYVPPNSGDDYHKHLLSYLAHVTSSAVGVIFVGDFNLPDICWASLIGQSPVSNSFCDFVYEHNLSQLVDCPTHVKGNILDLVLTNSANMVSNLLVTEPHPLIPTDHHIVSFNIQYATQSKQSNKHKYVYDFSKADFDGLCNHLLETDFSDCYNSADVEDVWSVIKLAILYAMNLHIPQVKIKSQKHPKWYNSDVRHHLNCIRTLRRRCFLHPTIHNSSKLQMSETQLQHKMLAAKASFEADLIQESSPKNISRVYRYINSITRHDTIPPTVSLDSHIATSDIEKANLFNTFFHSVFTHSSYNLPPLEMLSMPPSTISDITISESDVYDAMTSLNPTKAMGIDGIGPRLLKHCALALYQPLHHLFTLSLVQHYLPQEWRFHLITPIYKSGNKSSVKNYRPISLLCIVSKVLEKIVYDNIVSFVSRSISSCQFGFRRNHSPLQQLLIFLNSVHESFGTTTQTDVIYLDFKKAFDSVAHNELLVKLWSFGIQGNLWKWFRGYLTSRMQCVSINTSISAQLPVISGVPQGSILGPLLFLIFVNDLPPSASTSSVFLFADDTKCLKTIRNISDCLSMQKDLQNLTIWSQCWKLNFNVAKCALLRFSSGCSSVIFNYTINDNLISAQETHRDLGIIMSSDLSWREHMKSILCRAYKTLNLVRRSFSRGHSPQTKKIIYLSLIRSQLTYCSQIWRPHLLKDIVALEKIQRRATKYVLNDYTSDYRSRLIALHILPLMMQLEVFDVMFFIRCLKAPTDAFNIYDHVTFHTSSTRSSTHLKLKHVLSRTNSARHFYFNRIPRLWNSLPTFDLDQSISSIKREVQQFFWDHFLHTFKSDSPCSYHFMCPCSKCSCLFVTYNFN